MTFKLGAAVLVAGLITVPAANADIVTFEDLAAGSCNSVANPSTSGDYTFEVGGLTSPLLIACDSTNSRLASNGSNYLTGTQSASGGDLIITMTNALGAAFDLLSVDLAEVFKIGDFAEDTNAAGVEIVGNFVGGGTVTQSVLLDGVVDGPGGSLDFQTFLVSSAFTNLSSVIFTGYGGTGWLTNGRFFTGTRFALDNLQVQASAPSDPTSSVPAPAGLGLIGLGLAGLGLLGFGSARRAGARQVAKGSGS